MNTMLTRSRRRVHHSDGLACWLGGTIKVRGNATQERLACECRDCQAHGLI
jgi:hypothetical protein